MPVRGTDCICNLVGISAETTTLLKKHRLLLLHTYIHIHIYILYICIRVSMFMQTFFFCNIWQISFPTAVQNFYLFIVFTVFFWFTNATKFVYNSQNPTMKPENNPTKGNLSAVLLHCCRMFTGT